MRDGENAALHKIVDAFPLSQLPGITVSERLRLHNLATALNAVPVPSLNDQIQQENLVLHAQALAARKEESGQQQA